MPEFKTLHSLLEYMKARADVKEYRDAPTGCEIRDEYMFTYCRERTVMGIQPTLAISRLDRQKFMNLPREMTKAIDDVFGKRESRYGMMYPMRGFTVLFTWKLEKE